MKKKSNFTGGRLALIKEKIVTLTPEKAELLKGGDGAIKIPNTSGGAGCTNRPTKQ